MRCDIGIILHGKVATLHLLSRSHTFLKAFFHLPAELFAVRLAKGLSPARGRPNQSGWCDSSPIPTSAVSLYEADQR